LSHVFSNVAIAKLFSHVVGGNISAEALLVSDLAAALLGNLGNCHVAK